MSASLVGSEMCIRDSEWPPAGAPGPVGRQAPAPGERPGHDTPGATAAAVSYTHLTLPTICSV
eukprot:2138345-Alexandrium_andersonii.AAC.1